MTLIKIQSKSRVILLGIFLTVILSGWGIESVVAQKKKPTETESESGVDEYWKVYRLAVQYGDPQTAINSLYHIMAKQPNNMAVKDSLASIYFGYGMNSQAINLGEEILKSNPKDVKHLEMTAIAYRNLGILKESVTKYETLYSITKDPYHLYQLCIVEYALKRYEECAVHLRMIVADPSSAEQKITINENDGVKVILKSAALNVLGVIHRDLGKTDEARQFFQQAMEADSTFALPKGNLEAMDKKK